MTTASHDGVPMSPVDPSAHLPDLAHLGELTREERKHALGQWVAWFNGHRHHFEPGLEEELNEALLQFDSVAKERNLADLTERAAEWLRHAGVPGSGQGPDEDSHESE